VLTVDQLKLVDDPRFELTQDRTLRVSQPKESDAGELICFSD